MKSDQQRPSKSKQRLEQVLKSMQAREKTNKPSPQRKAASSWSSFYHEELSLSFTSNQPLHLPPRTQTLPEQTLQKQDSFSSFNSWDEFDVPATINSRLNNTDDEEASSPTEWHKAISNRDWDSVETLLLSYDHTLYWGQKPQQPSQKSLRGLIPFSYSSFRDDFSSSRSGICSDDELAVSPLLKVDSSGRTPLHLACIEQMPSKLTQQLFSLEKSAALTSDGDGRLPLHFAAMHHLDRGVLDRLVRSNPSSLATVDSSMRTPLKYVILQAEQQRDKKLLDATWKCPLTQQQSEWQAHQAENWQNVQLVLDNMIRRQKLLSSKHERSFLLDSIQSLAPPAAVDSMLSVAAKILQNDDAIAMELFWSLFRYHYPISIFEKALKICGHTIPIPKLVAGIQKLLMKHYGEGCVEVHREKSKTKLSFRVELLESNHQTTMREDACQEWWDKLKYFLSVSSYHGFASGTKDELAEDQLVHSALIIPEIPPSLIQLLIRMAPNARYEPELRTQALPIHLACKYIQYPSIGKNLQVFNLLMGGDSGMCQKLYRYRSPLHLAVLARKPLPIVQAMLALDPKSAGQRDPLTRLFPFQLAASEATVKRCKSDETSNLSTPDSSRSSKVEVWGKLDSIFELLKAYPVAVGPTMFCGSGNPNGDVGPLAQYVLNWCFSYNQESGWTIHNERTKQIQEAISNGCFKQGPLKTWWNKVRQLIWQLCKIRSTRQKIRYKLGDDNYLLHAALSNGVTPPIIIKLILKLFSESVKMPIPGTDRYPIHLAARSPSYAPLPFETEIPMPSALELVALANPEMSRCSSNGKMPLQLAICSGKTWQDIRTLVYKDPKCLLIQDMDSGLFPFQQIASKESFTRSHRVVRSRIGPIKWYEKSAAENGKFLMGFQADYQRDKLTSVFEILRAKPDVLDAAAANQ